MTEPTYTIELIEADSLLPELVGEPIELWQVTATQLLEKLAEQTADGRPPLSLDLLQSFLDQGMNAVILYEDEDGTPRVGLSRVGVAH